MENKSKILYFHIFSYRAYINLIQEKYSKHIDICYHYIKDLIKDEQVKLYYINRKDNTANILDKNLNQVLFSHFCPSLNLEILIYLCFYYLKAEALSERKCCETLHLVSV